MNDIPRLILNQFRWIDSIADGKELASNLLHVCQVCPLYLQKEIISMLPDIVDDSGHGVVVLDLINKYDEGTELTATIFDALSNLSLAAPLQERVLQRVISTLSSTSVDDLPVILRFMLQAVATPDSKHLAATAQAIRRDLDFDSFVRGSYTSKPPLSSSSSSSSSTTTTTTTTSSTTYEEMADTDALVLGMCVMQLALATSHRSLVEKSLVQIH
jgi:hypothetical protein